MKKKSINNLGLGIPLIILVIGLGVFLYIKLSIHRYLYAEYVDQRLRSAANATGLVVPESLIDSAFIKKNIDILTYDSIQRLTNKIAKDNNVVYVYVMVMRNDTVFFVISSFIEEDISNNIVTRYMDVYDEASEKLKSTFGTAEEEVFDVTLDIWGHFRSIYLPRITKNGTKYIIGADIRSMEIVHQQWIYLVELLLSGLGLLIIALPLILRIRKIVIICRSENKLE